MNERLAAADPAGKARILAKPNPHAHFGAIFSPDEAAIAHARRVIAAFEEADSGLVVLDNKLIEKPVLRTMYRTVRIAERIAAAAE